MEQSKSEEQTCPCKCRMNCPKGRCCLAIGINILFFSMWYSQLSLMTLALYLLIGFLSFQMLKNQLKQDKEEGKEQEKECCSSEKVNACVKKAIDKITKLKAYLDSVASLNDTSLTVEFFVTLYIASGITSLFSGLFLMWVIVNLVILHEPINRKYPDFLFYSYLYVKQMIEGVIGLIECLIPRYEEVEVKDK